VDAPPLVYEPDARQFAALVHDTPVNPLDDVPAGAGGMIGCAHVVPLNPAAKGAVTPALSDEPTAAQNVFPDGTTRHDTPVYRLPDPGPALTVTTQLVPLKCSTSSDVTPAFVYEPTASQLVADTHDTPLRRVADAPVTLAPGLIDQLVPFQCNVSVLVTKLLVY
jgi:hypothetical protein